MLQRYYYPKRRYRKFAQMAESNRPHVHVPVDVSTEDDTYVITAFVPGIAPEDVKIEVVENTVTISGEFIDSSDEDAKFLLRERPSGEFSRSLKLPTELDAGKSEAEIVNGVLTLRVPKAEIAKAKLVKVKAK
jgi:HSP20 family protein